MKKSPNSENQILTAAGLTAPIAYAASGINLMNTAIVSLAALGCRYLIRKLSLKSDKYANMILSAAAAGGMIEYMKSCWPSQRDMQWIAAILLLLAIYGRSKGREAVKEGGILLWWAEAFLFGSILISSFMAIKEENLNFKIDRMMSSEAALFTILILPSLLGKEKECPEVYLTMIPAAFSCASVGILGLRMKTVLSPFYELCRSIRLYGIFDRMEALGFMGILLGTFLFLSFSLWTLPERQEKIRKRDILLTLLGLSIGVFGGEFIYRGGLLIAGAGTAVYAQIRGIKKKCQKMKKDEKTC